MTDDSWIKVQHSVQDNVNIFVAAGTKTLISAFSVSCLGQNRFKWWWRNFFLYISLSCNNDQLHCIICFYPSRGLSINLNFPENVYLMPWRKSGRLQEWSNPALNCHWRNSQYFFFFRFAATPMCLQLHASPIADPKGALECKWKAAVVVQPSGEVPSRSPAGRCSRWLGGKHLGVKEMIHQELPRWFSHPGME